VKKFLGIHTPIQAGKLLGMFPNSVLNNELLKNIKQKTYQEWGKENNKESCALLNRKQWYKARVKINNRVLL